MQTSTEIPEWLPCRDAVAHAIVKPLRINTCSSAVRQSGRTGKEVSGYSCMSRNIWISSALEAENAQKTFSIFLHFRKYWNYQRVRKRLEIANKWLFLGQNFGRLKTFHVFLLHLFLFGLVPVGGANVEPWRRTGPSTNQKWRTAQLLTVNIWLYSLLVPIISYRNTFH